MDHVRARRAKLTSPTYAVREPLQRWLGDEAAQASTRSPKPRLLDVGCGVKPYAYLFDGAVAEYIGVDSGNPAADLEGTAEQLPVPDGSFELVLCTQTLEHANDPGKVLRELRRVVAPGGRVLLSTHGVQVYHPNPDDLWRWTHAGLERLFRENGPWSAVAVNPASGTTACVGMLVATFIDLLAKRAHVRPLGAPVVALVNGAARGIDRVSPQLRAPQPGTIFANYHVVAQP